MPSESAKLLICLVGLPRSGKSTWCRQHLQYPVVNADSIRLALHGQRFVKLAEQFVHSIAHVMVRALFIAGHNVVIVDECNVSRKRRDAWQSKDWETRFKVINTSEATCIARAMALNDPYIVPIISRDAREWEPLDPDEREWNPESTEISILLNATNEELSA